MDNLKVITALLAMLWLALLSLDVNAQGQDDSFTGGV